MPAAVMHFGMNSLKVQNSVLVGLLSAVPGVYHVIHSPGVCEGLPGCARGGSCSVPFCGRGGSVEAVPGLSVRQRVGNGAQGPAQGRGGTALGSESEPRFGRSGDGNVADLAASSAEGVPGRRPVRAGGSAPFPEEAAAARAVAVAGRCRPSGPAGGRRAPRASCALLARARGEAEPRARSPGAFDA